MSNRTESRLRIKQILVETLKLEGMTPESLGDETPLWGEGGLGLDSVDALELMVVLEQEYGVRIEDEEIGQKALANVVSLEALVDRLRAAGGSTTGGESRLEVAQTA